jgi:hypothetical protein
MFLKYFLSSYRAFSDAQVAISLLQKEMQCDETLLSNWKVYWISSCTLLRTAIDLFKVDAKICVSSRLATSFSHEWREIRENRHCHEIFWHFLREERNNIIHEYKWSAYEVWLDDEGNHTTPSIVGLLLAKEDMRSELRMKHGTYKGQSSLSVLLEGSKWVEDRIMAAIHRAGLKPNEERNLVNFSPRPTVTNGLLGSID